METGKYHEMADIENRHWWFRGRRYLFRSVLEDMQLPPDAHILELGCGTGGNLSMLQSFGEVFAVEMNEFSREHARMSTGVDVQYGKLPDMIPYEGKRFDLICMFDVLEHIKNDAEALAVLRSRLSPGGRMLLTVPATKWMFGQHDKMFHHFRRYTSRELSDKISGAGWELLALSYFNTLLFPLAVFARLLDIVSFGDNSTGMKVPPTAINQLFYRVFRKEKTLLKKSLFPFGLSLMAIACVS